MSEPMESWQDPRVRQGAQAVLGASDVVRGGLVLPFIREATERGYFTPDEDEIIRVRYSQYLGARSALLSSLASLEAACSPAAGGWEARLPAFTVALSAACMILRQARELAALATKYELLAKKLDEASPVHGIPRKTFTRLYRATTDPLRLIAFRDAADFYEKHRGEIAGLSGSHEFAAVRDLLSEEEEWIRRRGGDIIRHRAEYGWFSFQRRHRSAWKKSIFGFFEWSGRAIAELRQPGLKSFRAPKRVNAELREQILKIAKPGDVFVTRHDDALSNLFLPGYWPHAALYIGSELQRLEIGLNPPPGISRRVRDPLDFLESKKDGVRFRQAAETLAVDAFIILRPPLEPQEISTALETGMKHEGKLYDFAFDFRNSDRLACTEVVYRSYHGVGGISYALIETGGRLCLPAEELITQSLAQGFRVVAACGIGKNEIVTGTRAELKLHATRSGL